MTKLDLYEFIQRHKLGVLATISEDRLPEAAVVGIAVTTELELVFDTFGKSRKSQNLRRNRQIAFVVGWDEEITVQYEGEADEPQGSELDRCKKVYFANWPEGAARQNWLDITYFRVRPKWIRYSDFNKIPAEVEELTL